VSSDDQPVLPEMKPLIGRDDERSLLLRWLDLPKPPDAGVVFVTGEAGIGKTTLVEEVLSRVRRPVLRGEASASTSPYEPLVHVIRTFIREHPGELAKLPLARHLSLIVPELDLGPAETDPATLTAAICEVAEAAGREDSIVVLEDLHWADGGTLDVLLELAKVPDRSGLSVLGTYRNDELPRLHRLRGTRSQLRRARRLQEISLEPLSPDDSYRLAREVDPGLPEAAARKIADRSDGIPFFVEELAASMAVDEANASAAETEPPESLRDAIRVRTATLDAAVGEVLAVMAVAGVSVDLPLLADLVYPDAVAALIEHGWLVTVEGRSVSFRHALVRDAVYSDIPWLRRRERHETLAEQLEEREAAPEEIARHWVAAREPLRARPHLLRAARSFCSMHAYADARELLLVALAEWEEDPPTPDQLDALELLAGCSELSGDPETAVQVWQRVSKGRQGLDDPQGEARALRRLAMLLEMRGDGDEAMAARLAAAAGFERSAQPGDAAAERLAVADHLLSAGETRAAFALTQQAKADAEVAGDRELNVRVLALEGGLRAALGEAAGVSLVQEALGMALSEEYIGATAETYYRLGDALEHSLQYEGAVDAYESAFAYCQNRDLEEMGAICLACITPVMRHVGRWKEVQGICRDVMRNEAAPDVARYVASGELGLIEAIKGNVAAGRRLLVPALAFARATDKFGLLIECSWGMAMIHALAERDDHASTVALELVEDCRRREEWHYSVSAMRWCTTLFAQRGDETALLSAIDVLSRAASQTGSREAKAAMAHGLTELALLQGDAEQAAEHADRTLSLLEGIAPPYEVAAMRARSAVALAGAGRRDEAIGLLTAAYRSARKLGARPLASAIVEEFQALGESVEPHLGRRASKQSERAGLTRRELDVLRQLAGGGTNKEIAKSLFLSTRTVDMHVRNILMKLDARSRAEAVRRALELRLVPERGTPNPA
jgi:DNA-binding NarL/FixJ family response regulator